MWSTVLLTFLAGLLATNAVPHFVKGVTRERFPTPFGGSPVVNVTAGWFMLVLAAGLVALADPHRFPIATAASVATAVLLMALFHAHVGAFGRR